VTIFRMTKMCEILYVSRAVRRQLGHEPEEFLGKIIFDLIHEPESIIARTASAKSAEPGVDNSPDTSAARIRTGTSFGSKYGRMVQGENGQPNEIIITRDISDRTMLEE
jgi:PAS domain S-box-containing protein